MKKKGSPTGWTMIRVQRSTVEKLWALRRGERSHDQLIQRLIATEGS